MDANTMSLLQQQQHIQQLQHQQQQLSLYPYSNFNPMFQSQENQTFQLFAELLHLKNNHTNLTSHSNLRSDIPIPYNMTKLATHLSHLNPRTTSSVPLKPHDLSNSDGFQTLTNTMIYADLINHFVRTSDPGLNNSTNTDNLDNQPNPQSLAILNRFAHQFVQLNSRTCGSLTSPSISPESNRSLQLGDQGSPPNPINMKCASTPKQPDLKDRLQALERLSKMLDQTKQQQQQRQQQNLQRTNDDLSSGPLFDNSQYTPLQSSLEESGCIDLSYTGAQKIRSTSNEHYSSFVNYTSVDCTQSKQAQPFDVSKIESNSINGTNDCIQTKDALINLCENVKKPVSPPSMDLPPLTAIPLNFNSNELFSTFLRMKTPCISPGQNESTSSIKEEENKQELCQTSIQTSPNTVHHGRTKNRKSGFQAGVTVGYTYDAFFISDGRSRKRVSSKNPKSTNHTRHSSNVLSPNSQSGQSHSSSSSIDGSSLGINTNRPITPALSSHISLASTLSPTQDSNVQRYSCPDCGKNYATSSNLSRHKQTHRSLDSQSARKCPQCGKAYVSMPALSMHMLTHDLKHRCDICGKAFSRPWLLQGHRRAHTGEKPYGCAHCGRAFADRSNLRAHMQTHSGMKHFECKQCHKNFALKSYLNKHLESGCLNKSNTETGKERDHISFFQDLSSAPLSTDLPFPPDVLDPMKSKPKSYPSLSWSISDLIS